MSSNGISGDQLRSIVERIERLEQEKAATATDIKEVYAAAKADGFDTKILRQVVRIRKQDTAERAEQEALLDVYLAALGMTPIERAIADSEEEEEDGPLTPEQRKERARHRTSEAMDDAKDLSARMLADGLISPEAHDEQVRLADAVADKHGAGADDSASPAKGKGKPRSPATEYARDLVGVDSLSPGAHGAPSSPTRGEGKGRGRRNLKREVADAVARLGTPVPLTEEERAKGYSAALVGKDGTRMAIGTNVKV